MFFLDYNHDEYADNPGFVLAGAAQLVLSGAVLITFATLIG